MVECVAGSETAPPAADRCHSAIRYHIQIRKSRVENTLVTWENQSCTNCESVPFLQLTHLRVKPGGGTIPAPAGYQCSQCGKQADMAEMQRAAHLKQRRKELLALEEELQQAGPATHVPAAPGVTNASTAS